MLNTKSDLYRTEWLDLVFKNRNKNYGAYELRQHYNGTLIRAMLIAFSVVGTGFITANVIARNRPAVEFGHEVIVDTTILPPPTIIEPKKAEEPKEEPAPAKSATPVKTIQSLPPVVVPDQPDLKEPAKNADLANAVIGPKDIDGIDAGPGANAPVTSSGNGTGTSPEPAPSNEPVGTEMLEVQPEPVGGMGAFAKFLGRNMRYPSAAQDAEIAGRVLLTFVIERDGRLTDIQVIKGAGYGMDEEATRVLKLAKAWKPGIQNGRPVRVRFSIPINFQLPQ